MSEISVWQYITNHGGKLPWEKAVALIMPVMDAVIAGQGTSGFCLNLSLEQLCIDTAADRIHFQAKKVPFDALEPGLCGGEEYLPWELRNPWSRRGSAAEVYPLAVCLYTAIGGTLPPKAADRIDKDPLLSLTERGELLPPALDQAILKGLALNASDRYTSAEEFKTAVAAAAGAETDPAETLSPAGLAASPESPAEALDISRITTVSVSKTLESKATPSARKKSENASSIPVFVPVIAITCAFCLGIAFYQFNSRRAAVLPVPPVVAASDSQPAPEAEAAEAVEPADTEPASINPQNLQLVQYDDGSVYEGEWSGNARNGYGTLTLANGETYEGNWADDLLEGTARACYILNTAQGWSASFEGEFTANEPNGAGTYCSVAGSVQSGIWSVTDGMSISLSAQNTNHHISAQYQGMLNDGVPGGYGQAVWSLDKSHSAVYVGEWENGVPTGKGTYTAVSGELLAGDWSYASGQKATVSGASGSYTGLLLNGKPSGLGIAVWSNGDVSLTEYKSAVRSGYGLFYAKDGAQYAGLWSSDAMSGSGTYTWANGNRFVGTWSGAQRTGTLTTASGDTYKGTWKNDLLEGNATYVSAKGDSYSGNWSGGKKSGAGTYKWANGNSYTGNWSGDQPNGTGTMQYANGDSFTGSWTNGQHSDTGTYKWASGDSYEGTLTDGKKEGTGTYKWANGDTYTGSWSGDLQNGKGTLQYANGESYNGSWVNGLRDGTGTYKWTNGDSYAGGWTAGQKNGSGVYTWANGTTYSGTWVNGEPRKGGTYTYTDAGVSELMASGALVMCS